ncbi:MAG: PadR family transcriptional regulator [Acidobacteria bacterium]|nr:PadR family transcriptional regulator [Acidobacteriota bacterium]
MVMLALVRLGDDAYAAGVLEEIRAQTGRNAARGALYRTLDRLESKGLVAWSTEESTPARGGHPRRVFRVTAEGVEALGASREALLNLWAGIEQTFER